MLPVSSVSAGRNIKLSLDERYSIRLILLPETERLTSYMPAIVHESGRALKSYIVSEAALPVPHVFIGIGDIVMPLLVTASLEGPASTVNGFIPTAL